MIIATIVVLSPLTKMNTKYSLPQVKPKIVEEPEKPREIIATTQPSDYTVIGELNLFHPARHVPVDKKAEEIPKPELTLFGTMVQDNMQYAFIEDKKNPKTTPGRGSRQTTIKTGDAISGFVVSEIKTDRITLTKGDEKITVLLADADKRKNVSVTQGPVPSNSPTPVSPGPAQTITPTRVSPSAPLPAGTTPQGVMTRSERSAARAAANRSNQAP